MVLHGEDDRNNKIWVKNETWKQRPRQLHVRAPQTGSSLGPSIGSPLVGQPGPVPEPNWDASPRWNPHESYSGHTQRGLLVPAGPWQQVKIFIIKRVLQSMELPPSEYRKHSLQQETRGKYHKLREFLIISEGVSVCVLQRQERCWWYCCCWEKCSLQSSCRVTGN